MIPTVPSAPKGNVISYNISVSLNLLMYKFGTGQE